MQTKVDSVIRPLISKIKTLSETIWEGHAKEPAISKWLDNFSTGTSISDERLHALFLLSNFLYFGSRQIRELLLALFRDCYKYPIIEQIRRSNGDTLDSNIIEPLFFEELDNTRFIGIGNPSESGSHLLYYFRQENNLPKKLFIHSHQVFARGRGDDKLHLRDAAVRRYVFIDDFCGSGDQGVEYSRELVEDIKTLNPNAHVSYYVLFGTYHGLQTVQTQSKFDVTTAIYQLDTSFRCFSPDSRFFQNSSPGINQSFCETMCRKYGNLLGFTKADELGFTDSQLLIGFHHNTPDNTLPIIWFAEPDGAPWHPIFRRYPKLNW